MRAALAMAAFLSLALPAPTQQEQLINSKCPVRPTSKAKRSFVLYYNGYFIGFC